MTMVRWPVLLALLVSLGICGAAELRSRQKFAETRHEIAMREAELQKLADIDQQVLEHQKKQASLKKRVDLLQRVYQTTQRNAH